MRLKRLFSPVRSMDASEAKAFMASKKEGNYQLLDVRQPGEYEKGHIPGARLIPLPVLKDALSGLDPERPLIVY